MGTSYQLGSILLIENLDTVLAEDKPSASWTDAPTLNLLWITPHEVTHGSFMRHLLLAINCLDLIERLYGWGEAAVDTEDLLVDDGRQGKKVHYLCAVAPHVDAAVLAQTLVIKTVNLRDLT